MNSFGELADRVVVNSFAVKNKNPARMNRVRKFRARCRTLTLANASGWCERPAATKSRRDREGFSFDALADGSTTDALGANSAGGRASGGLFDMHGLQVDEVITLGDAGRFATVAAQVLGLTTFDF